jgi:NADH:ubiquinone oxidoreductase subunit F (NADH-binding)
MTARLHLVGPGEWDTSISPLPSRAGAEPLLDRYVTYPVDSPFPVNAAAADDLPAHLARYGERPQATGSAGLRLIEILDYLALDGRGGGHFPVAAKWRTHLAAGGGGVVVANGAESEPASAKDTALLQLRPHLVLDGLMCAAEAVGAQDVVLWLHEGAHTVHAAVARALAERRAAGLAEPPVRIVAGAKRYVSGESSSIVRALSGGPALPDFRRVPAAVSGVHGTPTLVQNAETLARTALAARPGGPARPPTSLLTVASAWGRTVVEVSAAQRLTQVIDGVLGPGASRAQQAMLIGGYGGTWIGLDRSHLLRADEQAARAHGLSLGAGVLMPLHRNACGLAETATLAGYLADGSARQCGPCVFGLRALSDGLAALVDLRARRRDVSRLAAMLDEVTGRGGCHHPDGAVRMIASALATFAADVRSHLRSTGCLHPGADGFFPVGQAD